MPKRNYSQRSYSQRSSFFARFMRLLMGVACIYLVNLAARGHFSPGAGVRGVTVREEVFKNIKTLQNIKDSPSYEPISTASDADKTRAAATIFSNRKPTKLAGEIDRSSPPTPESKEYGLWKNKYGIAHVLHSRFMQLQPDLVELGKARIELFKTFTFRSFHEQSTKEFLWIIFTDPELDDAILGPLKELIKFDKNILVLGMNHNFHDFRSDAWMKGIKKVHAGDMQMLKDYHTVAQNHVYLETRIDMDDSMYQDFMRQIQGRTFQTLGKSARRAQFKNYPEAEFRVYCPEHHLEWGYFNPWNKESKQGHLFGLYSPDFCITAGLSHAYQVGTKPLEITGHHRLDKNYPQCRDSKANNTNCLDRVPDAGYKYVVIRSRTPTSAGMQGVLPSTTVTKSTEWKEKQGETWASYIMNNFGVTPKSIWDLRQKLSDNMEKILQDAINGQCTRADFTCKDSSKAALNKILKEVRTYDATNSGKREAIQ